MIEGLTAGAVGSRINATNALQDEAKRLRIKADMLDELAKETDGMLTETAEQMLWALLMNQCK